MLTFEEALRVAAEHFGEPFARDSWEDDGAFLATPQRVVDAERRPVDRGRPGDGRSRRGRRCRTLTACGRCSVPRTWRGRRYARRVMTALWAARAAIPPSPSPSPTDLAADTGMSFTLDAGIVTAVISAAVAITIAVLTPALQSRQQRRDAVHAKFDAATAALLMVQAMRHVPHGMPAGLYPGKEA